MAAIACLLLVAAPVPAQVGTARISGRVTDSSGAALPGVTVTVSSSVVGRSATGVTDESGAYLFQDLPPGLSSVTFTLDGFQTVVQTGIDLRPGLSVVVDRRMPLAPLRESVTVVGRLPIPVPPPPEPVPLDLSAQQLASVCGPRERDVTSVPVGRITTRRSEIEKHRRLYADRDQVVLDVGTQHGIRVGQNFVVRREFRVSPPAADERTPLVAEHTAGVVQVVSTLSRSSLAVGVYGCDEFQSGDYVEPFVPVPMWPAPPAGTPDFDRPARLLFADEGQMLGAPGRFMVIDLGAKDGTFLGQRLTLYRKKKQNRVIGEATVVALAPGSATILIESANDAVYLDDQAALHRAAPTTTAGGPGGAVR